jgi:hypothetical protein
MRIKLITFCLLFITVFLSCKKDEISDAVNPGNAYIPLLSKVLIDNQPYSEYLYNDAKLIIEERSKFDITIHHYNNKNQIISSDLYANYDILSNDLNVYQSAMDRTEWVTIENGKKSGTITYEYSNNDQLIKTTYTCPSSGSSEYSEFTYDVNKRIDRQILYWENNKTGYIDYSYDGKGNLIEEALYNLTSLGVAELSSTTRYEFDNEQNPYKLFSRLINPGINTNRNNIIKETFTIHSDADQRTDKVQITENSYAYDGNGYPLSKDGNVVYVYK